MQNCLLWDTLPMQRWETRVISVSVAWGRTRELEEVLGEMDRDGWELVAVSSPDMVPPTVLAFFKRPVSIAGA